jgi:hypothetical protein
VTYVHLGIRVPYELKIVENYQNHMHRKLDLDTHHSNAMQV